jgi:hypothetical protein
MKELPMRTRIATLAMLAAAGVATLVGLSASPAAAANPTSVSATSGGTVITLPGGGFQTLGRIM